MRASTVRLRLPAIAVNAFVAATLGVSAGFLSACDCGATEPSADAGSVPTDGTTRDVPAASDASLPGDGALSTDAVVGCGTCRANQRCDDGVTPAQCVALSCEELACEPEREACVEAEDGSGPHCRDLTCSDSIECALEEYCDGTVCRGDVCTPRATECNADGRVRVCDDDGSEFVARYACGSSAYFESVCLSDAAGAACTCEDDWDCAPYTGCEGARCTGTGREPTCRLPAAPFSAVLPAPEPGFPWGGAGPGASRADGHPFPEAAQVVMTPLVVHLDDETGDGLIDDRDTPEIVFLSFCGSQYEGNGVLRAVHGGGPNRGRELFATCGSHVYREGDATTPSCTCEQAELDSTAGLAAGDIDGDGVPEIVAMSESDRLRIYSNRGDLLVDAGGNAIGGNASPSIANVDGAGLAEVIVGAHVFTFERSAGRLAFVDRFSGALSQGTNGQGPISCVANLEAGDELEVVGGSTVYRMPTPPAGVTRRSECAVGDTGDFCRGRLTPVWDGRDVNGPAALRNGFCAVADVLGADRAAPPGPANPLDGRPEVIVVNAGRLQIFGGESGMMFRDTALGVGSRGGAPNVDDFDGDGFPEIGTAGSTAYLLVDLQAPSAACPAWPNVFDDAVAGSNGNPARTVPRVACTADADCAGGVEHACNEATGQCVCLYNGWSRRTEDDSSQVTGSSVFDFNGDGAAEVIYNDECYFRVYSGVDGAVLFKEPSESRTRTENPVVADVDNDGNAEILFATSNESGFCSDRSLATRFNNGIEVWGDASDRWVAARRVWNQHSYHVTNVLESGGVPLREPESHRAYAGRGYNTYRSQPRSYGVAPNLLVERVQVSTPGAACGVLGRTLQIAARVANRGDLRVGPDVLVGFEGGWTAEGVDEVLTDAAGAPLVVPLGVTVEAGASVLVTATYDAAWNPRDRLPDVVRVVADAGDRERECVESDNTAEHAVDGGSAAPDLAVELGAVTGVCPTKTFETTVRNVGTARASGVVVRFYLGDPAAGGTAVRDERFGDIAPGITVNRNVALDLPTRDVVVYAVVDPDDVVDECDDSNNTAASARIDCGLF